MTREPQAPCPAGVTFVQEVSAAHNRLNLTVPPLEVLRGSRSVGRLILAIEDLSEHELLGLRLLDAHASR